MADDRKVRISIETKADPKGAKEVAKALSDIREQGDKIGADQWGFYDLDAALRKTTPKLEEVDKAGKKVVSTKVNLAQAAQQAGYQIGDFAVQVGSGTSALTAFAQQGSQVLGVLGPKGALAGALLAVGVAAYKAFSDTAKSEEKARKEAELLANALEETKRFALEASDDALDFQVDALREATAEAEKLKSAFEGTVTAQASYDKAQLSNIEKVRLAMVEVDRLNGKRIDDLAEIRQQEAAAAAERRLAAAQAIDAEKRKVQLAEASVSIAADELAKAQAMQANRKADLVTIGAEIAALKEKKRLLEETSRQVGTTTSVDSGLEIPMGPTDAAIAAKKELATGDLDRAILKWEADLEAIGKSLEDTGSLTEEVSQAAAALADAQRVYAAVNAEAAIKIKESTDSLLAADITGKVDTLKAVNENAVAVVQDAVAKAEVSTEAQKSAKALIDKALEDQILTAEEGRQVANAMRLLLGSQKSASSDTLEAMRTAIRLLESHGTEIHTLRQQLIDLNRKFEERIGR